MVDESSLKPIFALIRQTVDEEEAAEMGAENEQWQVVSPTREARQSFQRVTP